MHYYPSSLHTIRQRKESVAKWKERWLDLLTMTINACSLIVNLPGLMRKPHRCVPIRHSGSFSQALPMGKRSIWATT